MGLSKPGGYSGVLRGLACESGTLGWGTVPEEDLRGVKLGPPLALPGHAWKTGFQGSTERSKALNPTWARLLPLDHAACSGGPQPLEASIGLGEGTWPPAAGGPFSMACTCPKPTLSPLSYRVQGKAAVPHCPPRTICPVLSCAPVPRYTPMKPSLSPTDSESSCPRMWTGQG